MLSTDDVSPCQGGELDGFKDVTNESQYKAAPARTQHCLRTSIGSRFSPFEVEEVLQRHPALEDVLVFSVARPQGEAVGAVIVTKPESGHVGVEELRLFAGALLVSSMLPEVVLCVANLPQGTRTSATRARIALLVPRTSDIDSMNRPLSLVECEALVCNAAAATGYKLDASERSTPFSHIGIGSLAGVQLIRELNARLAPALELRETAVFDHPSIMHLAGAINAELGSAYLPVSNDSELGRGQLNPQPTQRGLIGSAVRHPGGSLTSSQCEPVASGGDAISHAPTPDHAPAAARHGGRLRGSELFDHRMFGISISEAQATDPQQRLLLELGYAATHMAGERRVMLIGREVDVVVGIMNADFGVLTAAGDLSATRHPCSLHTHSGKRR